MNIDKGAQQGIVFAIIILSVLIGIGGCGYLWSLGEAKVNDSLRKVTITNSFNGINTELKQKKFLKTEHYPTLHHGPALNATTQDKT